MIYPISSNSNQLYALERTNSVFQRLAYAKIRVESRTYGESGRCTFIIIRKTHNRTIVQFNCWIFEEGLVQLPVDVPI